MFEYKYVFFKVNAFVGEWTLHVSKYMVQQ